MVVKATAPRGIVSSPREPEVPVEPVVPVEPEVPGTSGGSHQVRRYLRGAVDTASDTRCFERDIS